MVLQGACLVTGAAGGLGRATAERLAKEGFKLVLLDKQGARLQTVAAELPEAIAVPGCVSVPLSSNLHHQYLKLLTDHRVRLSRRLFDCYGSILSNIHFAKTHRDSVAIELGLYG